MNKGTEACVKIMKDTEEDCEESFDKEITAG